MTKGWGFILFILIEFKKAQKTSLKLRFFELFYIEFPHTNKLFI